LIPLDLDRPGSFDPEPISEEGVCTKAKNQYSVHRAGQDCGKHGGNDANEVIVNTLIIV